MTNIKIMIYDYKFFFKVIKAIKKKVIQIMKIKTILTKSQKYDIESKNYIKNIIMTWKVKIVIKSHKEFIMRYKVNYKKRWNYDVMTLLINYSKQSV